MKTDFFTCLANVPVTPPIYDTIKPWLEGAYFISNIILVIGLWFAYTQMKLAYAQMKSAQDEDSLRSKRLAMERSIEMNKYMVDVLLMSNATYTAKHGKFKTEIWDFEIRSPVANYKVSSHKLNDGAQLLNELEHFSVYMISGIADEEFAFKNNGLCFCESVQDVYDVLVILRHERQEDLFSDVIELYKMWSARLEKLRLTKKSVQLKTEIDSIPQRNIPHMGSKG